MMNRLLTCFIVSIFASIMLLSGSAFADDSSSDLLVAQPDYSNYDDEYEDEWEDDGYGLSKRQLEKTRISVASVGLNWISFDVTCRAFSSGEYRDTLKIEVYEKRNGKYKRIKTLWMDEEDYMMDEDVYGGLFTIKKLKENSKHSFKFVITSEANENKKTQKLTEWTVSKVIPAKSVIRKGNSYKWTKAKGVKGYVVSYSKKYYLGKNMFGTRVYEWRGFAKTVNKPSVTLENGQVLDKVIPFSKHNGKYYFYNGKYYDGCEKSEKAMLKIFKYVSDPIYE